MRIVTIMECKECRDMLYMTNRDLIPLRFSYRIVVI